MNRNCKGWLWKRMGFLMPPHPLTNFEIQKYCENEPKFNGVYSSYNLPKKIKDGAYEIKFFISMVLVLNMFLKKLKTLSEIKTSYQTFFELKQTIQ